MTGQHSSIPGKNKALSTMGESPINEVESDMINQLENYLFSLFFILLLRDALYDML